MYRRKIESVLSEWKNNENRKPLVIKGCRQCGKTSSVRAFAYSNYKHVVYIDFHEQSDLCSIFNGSLKVDYLVMALSSSLPEAVFEPGQTCIIFDEVQDCPRARQALKYFKLDGRFDLICTGSLLGVNGYKPDSWGKDEGQASVPVGFEQIVEMYPMDFEEWLWANGIGDDLFRYLNDCLTNEEPIAEAIHHRMRQLLLQYVVIGGMPEAVQTFFNTHDVNQVIAIQRNIIDEYKTDMVKYAKTTDKPRIRECFESIPRQLSRDNKKFTYSLVSKGARSNQYISSLQWIEDAGIIRRCYNMSITELPLSGNSIPDCFKVYMADTGLFISMLDGGTQGSIIQGDLFGYKGAIFENVLADIFGKMGRKLYYYQKDSGLELDFVIRYKGQCIPVECKARTGNSKSLRTVLNHHEKYHVSTAIKLGDYNIGRSNGILTLPMYLAFLLTDY